MRKIAACYMRYSSHAQDDGFSIEAQEKAIRKYAEDNNLDLQHFYIDKAKSGTNAKRDEFQRMIEDSHKHIFEVCIVHKFDRFARNRYDSILNKFALKKNNVTLISVTENFNDSPEGVLMESMVEGFAEYYSKNLSREVTKGLDIVASQGLHTGGTPPLGYDVVDRKLAINEAEAEIVRLIFDRYANGFTYNSIAAELNDKGYKTKVGRDFTGASFNSILQQRKYIGEYVYNRRVSKGMDGSVNSHKNKSEEDIIRIPNGVPRIIDDDIFNRVQERLNLNKRKAGQYRKNTQYLLSGLVVCGKCGFHYQGNSRKSGSSSNIYSSYRCGKKQNHKLGCGNSEIEKNRLETFVLEQLQKYLLTDEAIKAIVQKVNEYNKQCELANSKDDILYTKQLKDVNKQISNLTLAIAKDIDDEIVIDKLKQLKTSKLDIEKRINEVKAKVIPEVTEEDIKRAVSEFQNFMKENKYVECKNFLNKYIEKIVVNETNVEVTFKVASATDNSNEPNINNGAVLINIAVMRSELKKLPKQRRKIPENGCFGNNYFVGYEIVTY